MVFSALRAGMITQIATFQPFTEHAETESLQKKPQFFPRIDPWTVCCKCPDWRKPDTGPVWVHFPGMQIEYSREPFFVHPPH
jgi:hypothetical protein